MGKMVNGFMKQRFFKIADEVMEDNLTELDMFKLKMLMAVCVSDESFRTIITSIMDLLLIEKKEGNFDKFTDPLLELIGSGG